jgi:hypothetical protein
MALLEVENCMNRVLLSRALRFLMSVVMKNYIFLYEMPCSPVKDFGGKHCLHLQACCLLDAGFLLDLFLNPKK